MPPMDKFKRLDVRPMLAKGLEPCDAIWNCVESLAPDQGLILVAPFLPSPLIEKLGSEGFQSRVERGEAASWIVYFWRDVALAGS